MNKKKNITQIYGDDFSFLYFFLMLLDVAFRFENG